MDTQSPTKERSPAPVPLAKFFGTDAEGRFKIKYQGVQYLGTGDIFELNSWDVSHGTAWSLQFEATATTPGYASSRNIPEARGLFGLCKKTGKTYFFVGTFEPHRSSSAKHVDETGEAPTVVLQAANTAQRNANRKQEKAAAQLEQLRSLIEQRDAGHDPCIRMSLLPLYLQESKASLYRKLGKDFPPPMKRGRSSFWLLSTIDAYKDRQSKD